MAQEHSVFSNIQDNRTSSLAEQVADQINQVIIDQNINAGEKLPNEFELAARLNVGRGTIREAVKLLVARNCLEIRRGKGTFVVEKPGQIEDPLGFAYVKDKITLAVDLMELRLQLEPWVAQLAAQRIEENEKDTLRQLCEQVEHKIRSGEDHGPADKEFHAYVARCTHNSVITEIMPVITYSIEMFTKFKAPRLLGCPSKCVVRPIPAGNHAVPASGRVPSPLRYAAESRRTKARCASAGMSSGGGDVFHLQERSDHPKGWLPRLSF